MIDIRAIAARIRAQIEARVDRADLNERAALLRASVEEAIAQRRLQRFAAGYENTKNDGLYECVRSDDQYLIETSDGRTMIVVRPGKGI